MKRIYGLLLLSAFLTPQTSHALNSRQVQQYQQAFIDGINAGNISAACVNGYNKLGDEYTPGIQDEVINAFRRKFGGHPSALCAGRTVITPVAPAPGPTPVTPVPTPTPKPVLALLNKKIDTHNKLVEGLFGTANTATDLSSSPDPDNYWNKINTFNKEANSLAIDAQALINSGIRSSLITPIDIVTTTNPLLFRPADFGPMFIASENAATKIALGTPAPGSTAGRNYPTVYVAKVSFDAATSGRKVPTTPTVGDTAETILNNLVAQYSVRTSKFLADRQPTGQAQQGDRDALLALAQYAQVLNNQASRYTVGTGYSITVVATTRDLTGVNSAEKLQQNIDQIKTALADNWFSAGHKTPKLYTVVVALDTPIAGAVTPTANKLVKNVVDIFNDMVTATFGLTTPIIPLASKANMSTALITCNQLASDLMKIAMVPASYTRPVLVATTENIPQPTLDALGSNRVGFIAAQNAKIRTNFASGATPTVYFILLPAIGNPIAPTIPTVTPTPTPAVPAPAPATPGIALTEQEIVENIITNHNKLVDELYADISGKVKALSPKKDAVKAINQMGLVLMKQALAYDLPDTTMINIISVNNLTQTAIIAEQNDTVGLIQIQINDTNAQLLTGAGYVYSTNHPVYKLAIPVKSNAAKPAQNLQAIADAHNDVVADIVGPVSAAAVATKQDSDKVVETLNINALNVMELLKDSGIAANVSIVTSNLPATTTIGTDPEAFIRKQIADTTKAFGNTWTGLMGHATPPVYIMEVPSMPGAPAAMPAPAPAPGPMPAPANPAAQLAQAKADAAESAKDAFDNAKTAINILADQANEAADEIATYFDATNPATPAGKARQTANAANQAKRATTAGAFLTALGIVKNSAQATLDAVNTPGAVAALVTTANKTLADVGKVQKVAQFAALASGASIKATNATDVAIAQQAAQQASRFADQAENALLDLQ